MAAVQRDRPWIVASPGSVSLHARTRCPCSCYVCKCTRQQVARNRDLEALKSARAEVDDALV